MASGKYTKNSNTEYTRTYENMRGVSFSDTSSDEARERFAYLENMYVDYDGDGAAIESVPGFRKIYSFGEKINGVHSQNVGEGKEYILVHAGTSLYRFEKSDRDTLFGLSPIGALADSKSSSFCFGECVYILDGESMYRIGPGGEFHTIGEEDFVPYVPTIYKDGKPYEDRNLLTNEFKETYRVGNSEMEYYCTPELVFSPTEHLTGKKTCEVTGVNDSFAGEMFIPKYATIGGERYTVTEIRFSAFEGNDKITAVWTNLGLEKINARAFFGCKNIKKLNVSHTVTEICERAFYGATQLKTIALGSGIKKLGTAAFGLLADPSFMYYHNEEYLKANVENYEVVTQYSMSYNKMWPRIAVGVKIHSPTESLTSIKLDGVIQNKYAFDQPILEEPVYDKERQMLRIVFVDCSKVNEKEIEICGVLKNEENYEPERYQDFFASVMGGKLDPRAAVLGCKCAATFDGRIFLSGNPALGGTVFYTASTASSVISPLYFGSRGYFVDGVGEYSVKSMITSRESLTVLKSGDDGGGSIFYHTVDDSKQDGDRYPLSYVHGGVAASGGACTFFDETLFLCDAGLCTLAKSSSSSYRSIRCLSEAVNQRLLPSDLESVSIAVWCGYLVLCCGEKLFLADSRGRYTKNGGSEYKWYYLNGVGTYSGDERVYRYASCARDGYSTHERADEPTDETVYSTGVDAMESVYYTNEGGVLYEVYPTDEMRGGIFSPASHVISCAQLLFFLTESGDLCVFNNDKRGVAPSLLSDMGGFDANAYAKAMGNKIHPYFYSFANHAPTYVLETVRDDCDVPYLTKKSVRGSLILKLKNPTKSSIVCLVNTDTGRCKECAVLPSSHISFDMIDFSAFSFVTDDSISVPIYEGESGWIYKQISVIGNGFCSPIGVYSINYRYKIKGKIRKI